MRQYLSWQSGSRFALKVLLLMLTIQPLGCGGNNTYNPDLRIRGSASPTPRPTPITSPTPTSSPTPGVGDVQLTVTPPAVTIPVGGTATFSATVTGTTNTAVTWAVQGGNASGTITDQGVYTAPGTPGTYTATATSQADTTKQQSVTITVTPAPSGEPVLGYAYLLGITPGGGNQIAQVKITLDGSLQLLTQEARNVGEFPGGIVADPQGRFVYAYDTPTRRIALFRIRTDKTLEPLSPSHIDVRETPNAMVISPDGQFLYVALSADGPDEIDTFRINGDGTLTPVSVFEIGNLNRGFGFWGLALHPNGRFLYATLRGGTEGDPQKAAGIVPFQRNGDGSLTPLTASVMDVPAGTSRLVVHPDGRSVYAITGFFGRNGFQNPAQNFITQFRVNDDGTLSPLSPATFPATQPTSLAVHPSGNFLYVSDVSGGFLQNGSVHQFAIAADGALTPLSASPTPASGYPYKFLNEPSGQFLFLTEGLRETIGTFSINADGSLRGIRGIDLGSVRQIFDGVITGP